MELFAIPLYLYLSKGICIYILFELEHGWSDLDISSVPLAQAQGMQVLVRHLVHFLDALLDAADIHSLLFGCITC